MPTLAEMIAAQKAAKEKSNAVTQAPAGTATQSGTSAGKPNRVASPLDDLRVHWSGTPNGTAPATVANGAASPAPAKKPNPLDGLRKLALPTQVNASAARENINTGTSGSVTQKPVQNPADTIAAGVPAIPTTEANVAITAKVKDAIVIPENLTPDQKLNLEDLKGNIAYLVDHIDNKDAIQGVMRNIITKLQANPDLCVFVPDQTIDTIVRGLRSAYKFEQRKAAEKKEVKSKTNQKMDKVSAMFNDMNFKI